MSDTPVKVPLPGSAASPQQEMVSLAPAASSAGGAMVLTDVDAADTKTDVGVAILPGSTAAATAATAPGMAPVDSGELPPDHVPSASQSQPGAFRPTSDAKEGVQLGK